MSGWAENWIGWIGWDGLDETVSPPPGMPPPPPTHVSPGGGGRGHSNLRTINWGAEMKKTQSTEPEVAYELPNDRTFKDSGPNSGIYEDDT